MDLLLDTHTFIWFAEGSTSLSTKARLLIENPQNRKYLSMISFFEMAIKIKIGKLILGSSLKDYFTAALNNGITILPISENHIFEYNVVPSIPTHKDPFDRLIIAIAINQKLDIISVDDNFANYSSLVNIIW
jgi:PIN domain nuclease of toxin-antitoxin system